MTLTRSYKETVLRRIQDDPEFAASLYAEALSALVEGDKTTALSILRDLVHARITFKKLAKQTGLGEKSLHRMFGAKGNPTLENLSNILQLVGRGLGLKASVTVHPSGKRGTPAARRRRLAVA
jgi:DNA-binding phage protein